MSLMLLAGCDSAALESPPPQTHALADGSNAQARVDVCHVDGKGEYSRITVAEASYDSHVAHGDGGVGDAVPGMEGYVFDENCQPVAAECPCFDTNAIRYHFLDYNLQDYDDGNYWTTSLWDYFQMFYAEARKEAGGYSCTLQREFDLIVKTDISKGAAEKCRAILFSFEGGGW